MRDDLQVESVDEFEDRIRVGIVAYRNLKPPITIVFEKKWGEEVRYIRSICRADKVRRGFSTSSSGWRIYAKVLAEIVIKDREERRRKRFSQESKPRLFD